MAEANAPRQQRVRVWFGSEVICSHTAEPERARRYAALMSQRYAGLLVTIDEDDEAGNPLPAESVWSLTIK